MKIVMNKKESKDFERFLELPKGREVCFQEASKAEIKTKFHINEIAKNLHPAFFRVRVKKIIFETPDTKSFLLEANTDLGTNRLPKFQEGQYIMLEVSIGEGIYKRAYTLSSSSSYLHNGEYQITIKKMKQGIVSHYFFEEVKEGDTFIARGPFGTFTFQPLRDSHHILAIAGGSGITPIMAMAEGIVEKRLSATMTILYGAKTEEDIIFHKHLDELSKKCNDINVVYILSEEEKEGYEHGFITKEIIEKYQKGDCSYFVCGPIAFYQAMNKILKSMDIPNKYIRHDFYPEFEKPVSNAEYKVQILSSEPKRVITCRGDETLFAAMERNGISAPKRCGVGVCGFCRSKLLEGEVLTNHAYVREADKKEGYLHPCATYPLSDVTIELSI